MKTKRLRTETDSQARLLRVLSAHWHVLTAAKADAALLNEYSALLAFLRAQPAGFLSGQAERFGEEPDSPPSAELPNLRQMSLDDLEQLISKDETPRRELERVAVERFSVPKGSMRSFSNKDMLIDKLRTLIQNERTHEIISQVARRPNTPESD